MLLIHSIMRFSLDGYEKDLVLLATFSNGCSHTCRIDDNSLVLTVHILVKTLSGGAYLKVLS